MPCLIEGSGQRQWVRFLERGRKQRVWCVLVGDWAKESVDRGCPDRGVRCGGRGWIRATMLLGGCDRHSGWPLVEDDPPGLLSGDSDEPRESLLFSGTGFVGCPESDGQTSLAGG